MSQPPKPRGLGRGLSALLGDEEVARTVATPPPNVSTGPNVNSQSSPGLGPVPGPVMPSTSKVRARGRGAGAARWAAPRLILVRAAWRTR